MASAPQPAWLKVEQVGPTTVGRFECAEMLNPEVIRIFGERLDAAVPPGAVPRVVLNFQGVHYVSSAVLGKLLWLHKKVVGAGGRLGLCGLEVDLAQVFKDTRLDTLLSTFADEAGAMEALRSGRTAVSLGADETRAPETEAEK
jgi:anti-sigma B factor antagonist